MKRLLAPLMLALGIHDRLSAEQKHDLAQAAWQSAPGAAAAGGTRIAGLPLSEVAVLASIFFIILQAGHLVWKWRRDARRERERRAAGRPPVDSNCASLGDR